MTTERSGCRFTVKESAEGQPWIAVEMYEGLANMKGILGLDLSQGTTYDQAEDVARYFKEHVTGITLTAL